MATDIKDNKRILKNTLALYFRQGITMLVALFTSRIVLKTLGITDYGINNVVGGLVAMFGFISSTLMGITQRFVSVELGKGGNLIALRKIFSTSMILHLAAGLVVLLLAETVGLWFLNNKLVIPVERMTAANWVYQFAVLGFILSMLNAPLTALVTAHEDMHIYGYMGIFDVAARLATVYLLVVISADKLMFLALLGFGVSCLVFLFYAIYCRIKYAEAKFSFVYDRLLVKELGAFGGWTFFNSFFNVLRGQGINIILNIFFGPAVNAARGIAFAVETALASFANNFRHAQTPQLMKLYAAKRSADMWSLTEKGTRAAYFLMLVFAVPVVLETDFILKLWLGQVPDYASVFTKLLIIDVLTMLLIGNLVTLNNATGKIRAFSILHYFNSFLILIISYFLCKAGYAPHYVFLVPIVLRPLVFVITFIILRFNVDLSLVFFAKKVLVPIFLVSVVSFLPFHFLNKIVPNSFYHSCLIIVVSIFWTSLTIVAVGLRGGERIMLINFVKFKLFKKAFK